MTGAIEPPLAAGHVAHQFTTTVRSPASAALPRRVSPAVRLPLAIGRAGEAQQVSGAADRPGACPRASPDETDPFDAGDASRFQAVEPVHFRRLSGGDGCPCACWIANVGGTEST